MARNFAFGLPPPFITGGTQARHFAKPFDE